MTAALAAVVARRLARIRPHVWAFQPVAPALTPQSTASVAIS
jgi:hypothetical protein